jgi:hypothetical protein
MKARVVTAASSARPDCRRAHFLRVGDARISRRPDGALGMLPTRVE